MYLFNDSRNQIHYSLLLHQGYAYFLLSTFHLNLNIQAFHSVNNTSQVWDTSEKSYCQTKILLGTRILGSTIISQSACEYKTKVLLCKMGLLSYNLSTRSWVVQQNLELEGLESMTVWAKIMFVRSKNMPWSWPMYNHKSLNFLIKSKFSHVEYHIELSTFLFYYHGVLTDMLRLWNLLLWGRYIYRGVGDVQGLRFLTIQCSVSQQIFKTKVAK